MKKIPVRGMRDILPKEMKIRKFILTIIRDEAKKAGFSEISTPAMEDLENLMGRFGGENEKLVYKVLKRGAALDSALEKGSDLAETGLRYDLTVPLARYTANNLNELPMPFRALQIGDVWRAEKPQKGRFRQFVQSDLDILGDKSVLAELTVVSAGLGILTRICRETGLKGLTLRVNDRRILVAAGNYAGFSEDEIGSVLISLDKQDKIGFSGVQEELLAKGFEEGKINKIIDLFEDFANLADSGNVSSAEQFAEKMGDFAPETEVISDLQLILSTINSQFDIKVVFDPTLVRGMGYYTGAIFECLADGLDCSVAGGGRYNQMIEKFTGGTGVAACGFSVGFERIVEILKDMDFSPEEKNDKVAILVSKNVPKERYIEALALAKELKINGKNVVSIIPMGRNLGKQIGNLENEGFEIRKIV